MRECYSSLFQALESPSRRMKFGVHGPIEHVHVCIFQLCSMPCPFVLIFLRRVGRGEEHSSIHNQNGWNCFARFELFSRQTSNGSLAVAHIAHSCFSIKASTFQICARHKKGPLTVCLLCACERGIVVGTGERLSRGAGRLPELMTDHES